MTDFNRLPAPQNPDGELSADNLLVGGDQDVLTPDPEALEVTASRMEDQEVAFYMAQPYRPEDVVDTYGEADVDSLWADLERGAVTSGRNEDLMRHLGLLGALSVGGHSEVVAFESGRVRDYSLSAMPEYEEWWAALPEAKRQEIQERFSGMYGNHSWMSLHDTPEVIAQKAANKALGDKVQNSNEATYDADLPDALAALGAAPEKPVRYSIHTVDDQVITPDNISAWMDRPTN